MSDEARLEERCAVHTLRLVSGVSEGDCDGAVSGLVVVAENGGSRG